jgi:hypothetical protein
MSRADNRAGGMIEARCSPPELSRLAIRPQIPERAGNSTARWVHSQEPGLCHSSQKLGQMIGAPVGAAISARVMHGS